MWSGQVKPFYLETHHVLISKPSFSLIVNCFSPLVLLSKEQVFNTTVCPNVSTKSIHGHETGCRLQAFKSGFRVPEPKFATAFGYVPLNRQLKEVLGTFLRSPMYKEEN